MLKFKGSKKEFSIVYRLMDPDSSFIVDSYEHDFIMSDREKELIMLYGGDGIFIMDSNNSIEEWNEQFLFENEEEWNDYKGLYALDEFFEFVEK
jgi:hypothetical protein